LGDQATWGKRRTLPPRKPRLLHRTATFGTLPPRSAPVGADRRDHAVPPLIRRAPWRLLGAMRRDQRRFQDQTGRSVGMTSRKVSTEIATEVRREHDRSLRA